MFYTILNVFKYADLFWKKLNEVGNQKQLFEEEQKSYFRIS